MPLSRAVDHLPDGTVTFLFSDVEGSTRILEGFGAATGVALERHFQIFERVVQAHHGVIFKTVGDAVHAVFAKPADAVAAALDAHRDMARESWDDVGGRIAVRIAIHTGTVERRGDDYFGAPLFRCARLQALAYGEQTVVSGVTATLVGTDLPPGARLEDRGAHRLKDLQEPEHVFELQHPDLRTSFPPLKSLDARPHNLPMQLSSFVGRDPELEATKRLIESHRLVTLLGPGGIGKTRLALQAAADQIERFADGVWFVDLAPIRDPEMVADAIASVLGVREGPDRPTIEALLAHLRTRDSLLVLDNLEQLVPAIASTVAQLVGSATGVRVLATSRAPLRIRGEVEYEVPSLGAGALDRTDPDIPGAVALFLDRARAIRPELEIDDVTGPLIATICDRLDGLPLAIELAAARLRLYSLQALHDRLDQRLPVLIGGARDLPERQQTMRATIAWSDELLAEPERDLFHRLGVFAGSFSLDGVRAVAGPAGGDVETQVGELLERSLVRRADVTDLPRFAMLESIREYAVDRLVESERRDETMDRMADHLARVVREADQRLIGGDQPATLRHLDADVPNFRTCLEWLRDRHDADRMPELVASLARFWVMRGQTREGRGWVSLAAGMVPDDATDVRARIYFAEGRLLSGTDLSGAVVAYEQAVMLYRQLGDVRDLGRGLVGLSFALRNHGEIEASERAASEGRDLARAAGDLRTEAAAIGNLASVAEHYGRAEETEAGYRTAIDLFRKVGDLHAVVIGLGNLGVMAAAGGDFEAAADHHRSALAAARELDDHGLEGWSLANLAWALGRLGRWREGVPLLADGLRMLTEAEDRPAVLDGLNIAAGLLHAGGDPEGAALGWSMASALSASLDIPFDSTTARDDDEVLAVRKQLGDAFDDAERRAATVSIDEAVDIVVERIRALGSP